jgi:hypothetical protein
MKTLMLKGLAIAVLFATGVPAFAGDEAFDIDNKFRAKIAKEKVKEGFAKRENEKAGKGLDSSDCGSQNIGNVDTGGRPGTAPREVFVFAPNAINLVTAGGCR